MNRRKIPLNHTKTRKRRAKKYEKVNALYNRLTTARQIFLILYFALLLVHLHKNATKRTLKGEISIRVGIHLYLKKKKEIL